MTLTICYRDRDRLSKWRTTPHQTKIYPPLKAPMSFIDPSNLCGQTLLRLSSRGSSLIAELFRLSNNIPAVYQEKADKHASLERQLLFDFNYLKRPEYYERKINASEALQVADDELQDTNDEILIRFYNFFEGIVKYVSDIKQYFDDLEQGIFLQHDIETVLLDQDGKQLVCEVFYLLGTILIFLDLRIPGLTREQLIVGHYRRKANNYHTVALLPSPNTHSLTHTHIHTRVPSLPPPPPPSRIPA